VEAKIDWTSVAEAGRAEGETETGGSNETNCGGGITAGANRPRVQGSAEGGASTLLGKKMANWCFKRCRMIQGGTASGHASAGSGEMRKRMHGARAREAQVVRAGEVRMISISRRILRLLRRRRRPQAAGW
jgi:hypothetical protein